MKLLMTSSIDMIAPTFESLYYFVCKPLLKLLISFCFLSKFFGVTASTWTKYSKLLGGTVLLTGLYHIMAERDLRNRQIQPLGHKMGSECLNCITKLWLPRWLSGKESACQFRRRGFDPWVRKIPLRREWQPTPVFLHWEFHGQRSLVD